MSTLAPAEGFMTAMEVCDRYGIDTITAETIRAGFIAASRHMEKTLNRSAFSNVVREILDAGTAIHLITEDGTEEVAITEGCCHFAFTLQHMTNMVLDEWGMENLGPGDTLICNDPYRGSIHFPDLNLFRPVFWDGEPVFVLGDASHILDIGGPVQGGLNNSAQTTFEEGLRIPPMLVTSGDKPVRSTINLLLENTRLPMQNLGDLRALFGTMKVGEQRLLALLARYGLDAVRAGARYTLDLAERRMRKAIAECQDGEYGAEVFLDDDGSGGPPVRVAATATVRGDSVEIDYSGSDRQSLGALTTCWEETNRCLIGPKVILDPRHPMNAGAMRPFHVIAPPGCVVMGLPPTSVSSHGELGVKVATLMTEIFGQMRPDRAIGDDSATTNGHVIAGIDERPAREGVRFGAVTVMGGAWGGTPTNDGISFNISALNNISDNVIELLERDTPVVYRSRNLAVDSAAPGKFRSGYTTTIILECPSTQSLIYISSYFGAGRFPGKGKDGGAPGITSYLFHVPPGRPLLHRAGLVALEDLEPQLGLFDAQGAPDPAHGEWRTTDAQPTLLMTNHPLTAGQALYLVCNTGGGYGSPLERDPELVRVDVWNEKVSVEYAREVYGVVIDERTLDVDVAGTEAMRGELAERDGRGEYHPIGGVLRWPSTREELERRFGNSAGRR